MFKVYPFFGAFCDSLTNYLSQCAHVSTQYFLTGVFLAADSLLHHFMSSFFSLHTYGLFASVLSPHSTRLTPLASHSSPQVSRVSFLTSACIRDVAQHSSTSQRQLC